MLKTLLTFFSIALIVNVNAQTNKPLPKSYLASHIVTIRQAYNDGRENNNVEVEIEFVAPNLKTGKKGTIKLHYNDTNHEDSFTLSFNKKTQDKAGTTYWYFTNDNTYPDMQIRYMFPPMQVENDDSTYSYIIIFSGNYTDSELKYKICYLSNELIKK